MKYNVHCYEIVRVMHAGIEADSPQEAAQEALNLTNIRLPHMLNRYEEPEVECMLECTGFIVDPLDALGNIEYDESVSLNQDMEDINAASEEEAGQED